MNERIPDTYRFATIEKIRLNSLNQISRNLAFPMHMDSQYNTTQYITMQYNKIRYDTIQMNREFV